MSEHGGTRTNRDHRPSQSAPRTAMKRGKKVVIISAYEESKWYR